LNGSASIKSHFAPTLLGVVLAGGKSSRMGSDKAMLVLPSGLTFLDHAIERLHNVVNLVATSGRAIERESVAFIPDLEASMGPAMAVYSAVFYAEQCGRNLVLITPVDMPDLTADHLRQLIDAADTHQPTCATFDEGVPHPLVAIYPVSLKSELERVVASPRRSLRAWLSTRSFTAVSLPSLALRNINTPDQLS